LRASGLSNFVDIFRLLYQGLVNDVMINGQVGSSYTISNGVKQGDALSCSLFILAMEPVLRNINKNDSIQQVRSNRLNFKWPKYVAYADDITVITNNDERSVQNIFSEYDRLTRASGLKLNADKTEKYDIYSRNINNPITRLYLRYDSQIHTLISQNRIKINGLILDRNPLEMKQENFVAMFSKMKRHFTEWSRRSLTLLGKIQIIKTFGISQYLYTLSVLDLEPEQWVCIRKEINKFLWNKNYDGRAAPHRIKSSTMFTSVSNGGFGMIDIYKIMKATRLRRFTYLMANNSHPIAELQLVLGGNDHLRKKPIIDIEDVTSSVLEILREHYIRTYGVITDDEMAIDLVMHRQLLSCKIKDVTMKSKDQSIEALMLRQQRVFTMIDIVGAGVNCLNLLCRVAENNLVRHLRQLFGMYRDSDLPELGHTAMLYEAVGRRWQRAEIMSSRQIRNTLFKDSCIFETKLTNMAPERATALYNKIAKLRNIANKTKLLRLLHGDVYCGSRLYRFGLSETDRCIRCFNCETTRHLLLECPYTIEVWSRLGLVANTVSDILRDNITAGELEILSELISALVFRKQVLPPEVLIRTTIYKFKNGLSKQGKTCALATSMMDRYELLGQWFT